MLFSSVTIIFGQTPATLTLDLEKPGVVVSPRLYGLMTEEINHSYDGGLYGELVRNRNFEDAPNAAAYWSLVLGPGDSASMRLDKADPVSNALPVCLKLEVGKTGGSVGIANGGYWGIPIRPGTTYRGSFYVRQSGNGLLQVSLETPDGDRVFSSTTVSGVGLGWKQYQISLTTGSEMQPTASARLVIRPATAGTYWFSLVSLFAPTYNDRPNGNRVDLMDMLRDLKPRFLRFPGGNYLEGETFSSRFNWKKTIGPLDHRPGHWSPWRYRSTDGEGLLEFLEWCEDLHMEPVLAVFAGFVLNKDYLESGPFLQPFVQDALDEIEYVTGDSTTRWGAERAKDGHPQPFKLNYIEIGNEDGGDYSGNYWARYLQFYDGIKARYPQLKIISTISTSDAYASGMQAPVRKMEIMDEHYYRSAAQMEENAHQFDGYDRNGPKVFVGEWATREGSPTTNFNAALGDAAWMTGLERNSDLVIMSCYAPLYVNVNPGAFQWRCDLIGYDALSACGSPSYYAQKLFSNHLGNRVVHITASNIPTALERLSYRDSLEHRTTPKEIEALFYVATRDTTTGTIFLKLVNTQPQPQPVRIILKGAGKVSSTGRQWVLSAGDPSETNSLSDLVRIVPVETPLKGIKRAFNSVLPPFSITVMELSVGKSKDRK